MEFRCVYHSMAGVQFLEVGGAGRVVEKMGIHDCRAHTAPTHWIADSVRYTRKGSHIPQAQGNILAPKKDYRCM